MKKIICLYGPPGAGKTTQADLLVSQYGFTKFGMGERLRAEIASGSLLGKNIKPHVDKGVLIPDEYMAQIVKEAEKMSGEAGLIFDGFPRIVSQALMLDTIVASIDLKINSFIYLQLSPEKSLSRIKERYLIDSSRQDDIDEEAIKNRFAVFEKESISLLDFYKQRKLLSKIDGSLSIEDINLQIIQNLKL